eukprot:3486165-Amphidinium_carterae.1
MKAHGHEALHTSSAHVLIRSVGYRPIVLSGGKQNANVNQSATPLTSVNRALIQQVNLLGGNILQALLAATSRNNPTIVSFDAKPIETQTIRANKPPSLLAIFVDPLPP